MLGFPYIKQYLYCKKRAKVLYFFEITKQFKKL